MHEPRTFNLFDWEHERLEDWDDPATQWSIDANSRLRPEHMYTMRVLEIWLDVYPSVFQEFPVMLVSDRCKKNSSEFEMQPHMKFFSFIALYFIDLILSPNFHRCMWPGQLSMYAWEVPYLPNFSQETVHTCTVVYTD